MFEVIESKRHIMIDVRTSLFSHLGVKLSLCAIAAVITVSQAAAQQPTTAQRNAVRSACRDDFMAHCSGVQPGGKAAFMCLRNNAAQLSAPCRQAVDAVTATAAPAPAATNPDASKSAEKPAEATTAPAQTSPAAPATPSTATAPAPRATAAAPPPAAPSPAMARPVPLRAEIGLIRNACGPDFRSLCGDVAPGGGRVIACLRANTASLSPRCQSALVALR